MLTVRSATAIAGVALLAGCVEPPPGPAQPTVMAVPGQGKDYAAFQQDDGYCRQTAGNATGNVNPSAAAAQNGGGNGGNRHRIGSRGWRVCWVRRAGTRGRGRRSAQAAGYCWAAPMGRITPPIPGGSIQHQYNMVYAQCMIAHGDQVQGPYGRPYGPPPGYYSGPPPGYDGGPPPAYGGPPPGYDGPPPGDGGLPQQ